MSTPTRLIAVLLGLLVVLGIGATVFVRSGMYNMGADAPHAPLTLTLLENLRDNATKAYSRNIVVPDLESPAQIAQGARLYSTRCTGCHLAPGVAQSELRTGLYPQPPDLSTDGIDDTAEAFWIIKHGIKMSAMPAWGKTHTDAEIWSAVAFLRKLPGMSPAQYQQLAHANPAQ
ncbi:c-type cytochrome [Cognatiluteimonas profundi]|uniref:c-type cytochrome n=1 Tax=Cognatiluteimonas profundi TaxID=2594501 RepID=UPI00131E9A98|nr:cytochrome c [Lysobacter profundi]